MNVSSSTECWEMTLSPSSGAVLPASALSSLRSWAYHDTSVKRVRQRLVESNPGYEVESKVLGFSGYNGFLLHGILTGCKSFRSVSV